MLLSDYIKSKLARFNVTLSADELEGLLLKNSIATDTTYDASTSTDADKVMYGFIPELLVMPAISQGGYSIKFDREGILAYYRILCNDLGLADKTVTKQPKIKNLSNRW